MTTTITAGAPATPDQLRGVVPPVLTPLTEAGEVDLETLRAHAERLIKAGVDALFVLGSSSEAVFLTRENRRAIITATVEQAAGRVPVIAGVIDATAPRVIEHVADAVECGANGLVATAPYYVRISGTEIANHFRLIHAAAPKLPLFAYNIPVSVHTVLDIADVITLAREGVLAGVKDSGGSDSYTRNLCDARDKAGLSDFVVLTGSETTVDMDYLAGVDGVVPGLGNVDPVGYVELARTLAAGDFAEGKKQQARLTELMTITAVGDAPRMGGSAAGVGSFKVALKHLGHFPSLKMFDPHEPFTDEEIEKINAIVDAAQIREP